MLERDHERVLITGGSGFIGTNLVQFFTRSGVQVLNIDCAKPRDKSQNDFWVNCDIRDQDRLTDILNSFDPTHVVHLAARTDLRVAISDDYSANDEGTRCLINSLDKVSSVKRVLFASSRLVCKIGHKPLREDEYSHTTEYGQSKRRMEEEIRVR